MADEMTRQEFIDYMTAFEQRLDARFGEVATEVSGLKRELGGLHGEMGGLKGEIGDLRQTMKVQFEDVRLDIRFSLEAVQGLRETTERGFSEMRAEHQSQTALIHDVLHHVRGRVERLERPAPKNER